MNLEVKIKTRTNNIKKIISVKYTKKSCPLYNKYTCEMLSVTDEIDRKSTPKTHRDIAGGEVFLQEHEITRYYLYISENPNDENKLVIESRCLDNKNIETVFEFLMNVFCFLLDAKNKDKIKGLGPILRKVNDLIKMETVRRCGR